MSSRYHRERSRDKHRDRDRHSSSRRRSRSPSRRHHISSRHRSSSRDRHHRSSGRRRKTPEEEQEDRRKKRLRIDFSIWDPSPTTSDDESCRKKEETVIKKLRKKLEKKEKAHCLSDSSALSDEETGTKHKGKEARSDQDHQSDSESVVGPVPDNDRPPPSLNEQSFGGALLPGEGSAMAAYVQSGERIPRRGEIGIDQNMISRLEDSGYIMSGNRHRRMNIVRERKEGQVISAEEKRQMLLQNQEERMKKETQIISEFRDMLSKKK